MWSRLKCNLEPALLLTHLILILIKVSTLMWAPSSVKHTTWVFLWYKMTYLRFIPSAVATVLVALPPLTSPAHHNSLVHSKLQILVKKIMFSYKLEFQEEKDFLSKKKNSRKDLKAHLSGWCLVCFKWRQILDHSLHLIFHQFTLSCQILYASLYYS